MLLGMHQLRKTSGQSGGVQIGEQHFAMEEQTRKKIEEFLAECCHAGQEACHAWVEYEDYDHYRSTPCNRDGHDSN